MVAITLMGRDFDVAPYRIGTLRAAAPIIDRVNATIGGLSTMEGAVAAAADLIAFLSIGLLKLDATLTPEAMEEEIGFEELPALQTAFTAILRASGFRQGEATAPSVPVDADEGSASSSASSSSSSLPPA